MLCSHGATPFGPATRGGTCVPSQLSVSSPVGLNENNPPPSTGGHWVMSRDTCGWEWCRVGGGQGCCSRPHGAQDQRPDLARPRPEPDAVGGSSGQRKSDCSLCVSSAACLKPPGFLCPELGTQRGRGMRAAVAQNLLEGERSGDVCWARPWGQRCVQSRAGSLGSGRRDSASRLPRPPG